jgi:hypothetical protein
MLDMVVFQFGRVMGAGALIVQVLHRLTRRKK